MSVKGEATTVHHIVDGCDPDEDLHYIRKRGHVAGNWGTAICGYSAPFGAFGGGASASRRNICPVCAVLYNSLSAE